MKSNILSIGTHKQTVKFSTMASLLALVLVSQPVLAEVDGKAYPGSLCEPSTPAGGNDFVLGSGWLNLGATPVEVICPIIEDIHGTDTVELQVLDQHPNEAVGCRLRSYRKDGTLVKKGARVESSGFQSTGQPIPLPPMAAPTQSYYILSCSIPSNYNNNFPSGIFSYNVTESN